MSNLGAGLVFIKAVAIAKIAITATKEIKIILTINFALLFTFAIIIYLAFFPTDLVYMILGPLVNC